MTYQEFVNKYNGQYVDTDHYPEDWPWQCYDLVQKYNMEVIDVPYSVFQGCKVVKNMIFDDEKHKQLLEYFDEVDVHAMQQGDVCIWTDGPGGHTAIYDHYDGVNCWYFTQNPSPCQIAIVNMGGHHAFRRKGLEPITPNVERDTSKNQIRVKVPELRVRTEPNTNATILGCAKEGYYNYYDTYHRDINDYMWYKIADNQWVAHEEWWFDVLPAEQPTEPPTIPPTTPPEEYVKFKVIDRKDGNVLVDIPIWIKE